MPQYAPPGPFRVPPQAGPQSNIVCSHCTTLLLYPQGAQNVRCARCGEITAVPPAGGDDTAQLVCGNTNCRVVLMYPRGAPQVQCSLCGTINCALAANQIGHIICNCCHITLMYAYGAASVKCAVCNTVTPVQAGATPSPLRPGSNANRPAANAASKQTVVVLNPSSVDAEGNEVPDYVVGVVSSDKPAPTRQ
jgi:LSD1 subclass zinc finger protein